MSFEWLALAAAFLWAIAGLLSVKPAQHLGTFSYSRWRIGLTAVVLSIVSLYSGGWASVNSSMLLPMILSGIVGIFIGDSTLFACLNMMGPRQSGLLFACHSVFSTVLGYFLFSEQLSLLQFIGFTLVFSGVVCAIFFGRKSRNSNQLETLKGNIWIGITLGLTAALCQSLGGIIAKPVMQTSIDPITASAIRMIAGFSAHLVFRVSGARVAKATQPMNRKIFSITALNGLLSMALGMTLILYALQDGNVGLVALLSSTTPIMLLPLLWIYTKQRPNIYAWIGAILAVIGTGILVT
ncbi:DMT family transporter [Vibrio marisflavi]|uniref:EamA domain-containing protein n=1 Tax=Vibrio marisflavi CECT 7928 TaxID=634439 RepID=A0ABN8EC58_9VIBR|nr:EamA family transporter [Vibrio marisflavi]CAH0542871.1 hypothetical protein VMF7928_04248 [Vibrio marisflavi CECT 7928]